MNFENVQKAQEDASTHNHFGMNLDSDEESIE
jgi:hypothetical protein